MKNKNVKLAIAFLFICFIVSNIHVEEKGITDHENGSIRPSVVSLTHPSDMTILEMTTGNVITWTVSGTWNFSYAQPYNVFRDGVKIASGNWNPGDSVSINVDGLSKGDYKFLIIFRNFGEVGLSEEDEVLLSVVENYVLDLVIFALINVTIIVILMLYVRPMVLSRKQERYLADVNALVEEYPSSTLLKEIATEISEGATPRTIRRKSPDPNSPSNYTYYNNITVGDEIRAELDRLLAEREEREKREAEEARMRDMFKKFMNEEESNKYAGDIDKMFDEWKEKEKDKKDKI